MRSEVKLGGCCHDNQQYLEEVGGRLSCMRISKHANANASTDTLVPAPAGQAHAAPHSPTRHEQPARSRGAFVSRQSSGGANDPESALAWSCWR